MRPLHTLHVCYSFAPDPPGGTEVYVQALCQALVAFGVHATVAAPAGRDDVYEVAGLRVRRFAAGQSPDLDALYSGDPQAAASFARLLDAEPVDLVHLHALTPACSPLLASEVKRRGLPLVFTLHTPTVTCQRGTLLEYGTKVCDGRVDVQRCAACVLDALGAGPVPRRLLASVPVDGGHLLGKLGRQGGVWTALRMSSLIGRRADGLARLVRETDRFVVLSPWVERVLRLNGVSSEKLVHSVHGISDASRRPVRRAAAGPALRVAHLGRLDPAKGTRLLIQAMQAAHAADIELDIYGVVQHASDAVRELMDRSSADSRIRWQPAMAPADVVERLSGYDVLAVPSQGLETGPLVVLEAFAAGVPVVGSDLAGIADKVIDGVNGILVQPFDSVDAWAAALQRLAEDPALVATLADAVRPPRSIVDVGAEMRTLYRSLVPRPADEPLSDRAPALEPTASAVPLG